MKKDLKLAETNGKIHLEIGTNVISEEEIIGKVIKGLSKILMYKVKLRRKQDTERSRTVAGWYAKVSEQKPAGEDLLDVIVDILTFQDIYGELYIYKLTNALAYLEEFEDFDIDSLFDDSVYLPNNAIIPNYQKSTVKVLAPPQELLGLYAYILRSIIEFFKIAEVQVSDDMEQYSSRLMEEYFLPGNLFSVEFDIVALELGSILERIDKMYYVKTSEYDLLHEMLYRFIQKLTSGINLPLYDLWEYICLDMVLEEYAKWELLFFDLEDRFFYEESMDQKTFKIEFNSKYCQSCSCIRPDIVIGYRENNGRNLDKVMILDVKQKEKSTCEDKVSMDLYKACVTKKFNTSQTQIDDKFLLFEMKTFLERLDHFNRSDKIEKKVISFIGSKYKEYSCPRQADSDNKISCLKSLRKILLSLKKAELYELHNGSIRVSLEAVKDKYKSGQQLPEVAYVFLIEFENNAVKINGHNLFTS